MFIARILHMKSFLFLRCFEIILSRFFCLQNNHLFTLLYSYPNVFFQHMSQISKNIDFSCFFLSIFASSIENDTVSMRNKDKY